MAVGIAILSAAVPGFLWLWVFANGRSYRGAPLRILMASFGLGMVAVIPAGLIEFTVLGEEANPITSFSNLATVAVAMFFVVGPVEETSKFLAVRLGVYRTRHLREPLDGLIYGTAASLGFATAENIGYALSFGAEIMVVRGPLSTVAHVIFGSIWALTLDPTAPPTRRKMKGIAALAVSALLHGLFNVLAFSSWGALPAVVLVVVGLLVVIRMFRREKARSTYHLRRNVPVPLCPLCGTGIKANDRFCTGCGTPKFRLSPVTQHCANCGTGSQVGAKFCSNCGDLFVYKR